MGVLALVRALNATRPDTQTFYLFVDRDDVLVVGLDFADPEGNVFQLST